MAEGEGVSTWGVFTLHQIASPHHSKLWNCGCLEIYFEFPQNLLQCKEPNICMLISNFLCTQWTEYLEHHLAKPSFKKCTLCCPWHSRNLVQWHVKQQSTGRGVWSQWTPWGSKHHFGTQCYLEPSSRAKYIAKISSWLGSQSSIYPIVDPFLHWIYVLCCKSSIKNGGTC